MDPLFADLRYALRQFQRQPLFHVGVALTLALGIGANTAIFSVVRSVLLEPLPYPAADRLVRVWNRNDERALERVDAALQDVRDWREGTSSIEAFAVWNAREGNLVTEHAAERVDYAIVSHDFFHALGVEPALGRAFREDDDRSGNDAVVIVSHRFWRDRLGGDASALGRAVRLDGQSLVVVGVMPPGFAFPLDGTALWKPIGLGPEDAGPRVGRWVDVVARLRPGASAGQAQAELEAIAARNAAAFADSNAGWSTWVEPLRDVMIGDVRGTLLIVQAAVALVLLIACANVTSLLLVRAQSREGELAVRAALGAGRAPLVRQLLVESTTLALAGGALALIIARPMLAVVARLGETGWAGVSPPRLDAGVLAYAFGIALFAGLIVGMLPALRWSHAAPADALRRGRGTAGSGSRARAALVAVEVALAALVLVAAGLLVRSMENYARVDVGVALDDRLTLRLAPAWADLPERERAAVLWRRVAEEIDAIAGINAVGAVNRMPLEGNWWSGSMHVRGDAPRPRAEQPTVLNRVITPGFLAAAGIPLVRGRVPGEEDIAAGRRVIALSEAAAHAVFGDADPIGAVVTNEDPTNPGAPWYTVVGVVGDVRYGPLGGALPAASYTTLAQSRWGHFGDWGMTLVIHTDGESTAQVAAVQAAIARVDPLLPAWEVRTMRGRVEDALSGPRQLTRLVGALALLALVLAAIGTYAVLAFAVSRQLREIGVRIAIGASGRSILGLVLRRGAQPVLIGLAAGLLAAAALAPALGSVLFGVAPLDGVTFARATAVMLLAALGACLAPAWRASRSSPMDALSRE